MMKWCKKTTDNWKSFGTSEQIKQSSTGKVIAQLTAAPFQTVTRALSLFKSLLGSTRYHQSASLPSKGDSMLLIELLDPFAKVCWIGGSDLPLMHV